MLFFCLARLLRHVVHFAILIKVGMKIKFDIKLTYYDQKLDS